MQNLARLALRWLALALFAVWFGGFTFYSAVVIPVLHEELGGLGQGGITGEVTNTLNALGVGAIVTWWVLVGVEWAIGENWSKWLRIGILTTTSAVLAGLIALHPVLDARLETGSMRNFYPLHQVYLIASTVQWGLNLALLAVTLRVWQVEPTHDRDRPA